MKCEKGECALRGKSGECYIGIIEDDIELWPTLDGPKIVKCRKDHACHNCGREIEKGECAQYRSGTIPNEGLESFYLCTDCMAYYFKYGEL